MCRLARAIAITREPMEIGPVVGYAIPRKELKKLYSRNGFQNLELIVTRHVEQWIAAEMVFEIRENIFFYLDPDDVGDRNARNELVLKYSEDERNLTLMGYMP